jgi:hypothetical protein
MEDTLIYKRTHKGDPDEAGIFGIHECMGRVRGWSFEAVIGVGGKSPWRGHEGIALKINWIGIGPFRTETGGRGPRVGFDHFVLLDEDGPELRRHAPNLFRYMFEDQHVRLVMSRSLDRKMQEEVQGILRWAKNRRPRKPRVAEKRPLTKRGC